MMVFATMRKRKILMDRSIQCYDYRVRRRMENGAKNQRSYVPRGI